MTRRAAIRTIAPRIGGLTRLNAPPAPKQADPFYSSPEWTALRARLIRERGPVCETCGNEGARLVVDHVVELKDGGAALDPTNLRLCCWSCHGRKTSAERAKRTARNAWD